MVMPTAQILKDRTTAAVRKVIREMEINVMTLMNARLAHITVMLMPTAPTPKDHSIVPVIRVTREMESRVLIF